MTNEEYVKRVSKLTSAIAQWVYKNNPSQEKITHVMERANYVIQYWHNMVDTYRIIL